MKPVRLIALLIGLGSALGCRPREPSGQTPPRPPRSTERNQTQDRLNGTVHITGSEPYSSVTLIPANGPGVSLSGRLQGELARLAGARVQVRGTWHNEPPAGALNVQSYEVLEIDGKRPKIGILTTRDGAVRLAGQDTVELFNPPERLRQMDGVKVWVVGHAAGQKLTVQSYGVLRDPRE